MIGVIPMLFAEAPTHDLSIFDPVSPPAESIRSLSVLVLAITGPLAASRSHVLARMLPRRLFPGQVPSEAGSTHISSPPAPTGGAIS